ncbi:glycosyltransferase family 4 protein [Desulfotalea psychrophila]|uniref:Related to glycosyltransferase n=1 Tax=Desulfotalea psychrophila (strain LSv54 / DSM 12343) TaxID=177439 RepID=Q6AIA6_DESPS|nr:glycosyltransferase family 4 protein [Desulfotalea psychrophila]CAG37941.1 related to glycosyltransferase [Desulfotalea psychrophila LSv54]
MSCANYKLIYWQYNGKRIMRIVHISYHFDEYVLGLAEGLSDKVSKKFIFVSNNSNLMDSSHKAGFHGDFIKFHKPRIRNMLKNIILIIKIFFEVKSFKPDIIHFQGEHVWFIPLRLLFRKYGIVITVHDVKSHIGEEKKWIEITQHILRKMSHKFIVHGEILKNELLDKHPWIENQQIHVIPHGPLTYYRLKNSNFYKEQENTILFFGRIHHYKGLDILIKAEPLISKKIQNLKIIVAGRCSKFGEYEKLITDYNKYKIINKFIPDEEISQLFQEASVIVLPYREASQSGIIPIAYDFKKAVVASNVGAISEVVDHLKTGILVEKENVNELANALCDLLICKEKRERFGEAGHKKLYSELNWNIIGDLTVDVYQSLINNIKL